MTDSTAHGPLDQHDRDNLTAARGLAVSKPKSRQPEDVADHLGQVRASLQQMVRLVDRLVERLVVADLHLDTLAILDRIAGWLPDVARLAQVALTSGMPALAELARERLTVPWLPPDLEADRVSLLAMLDTVVDSAGPVTS